MTDELLGRLRASFAREHEQMRDPVTRALGFQISSIARDVNMYRSKEWHRDPFAFRAFKLAVTKLLNALEPEGDPVIAEDRYPPFKTAEALADFAADSALSKLFYATPLTKEQKRALIRDMSRDISEDTTDWLFEALVDLERERYELERARNYLQPAPKKRG